MLRSPDIAPRPLPVRHQRDREQLLAKVQQLLAFHRSRALAKVLETGLYKGVHPAYLSVALRGQQVVGYLIWASTSELFLTAELLFLFVEPEVRHQGIATALFRSWMGRLERKQFAHAHLLYSCDGESSCLAMEALLRQFHWSAPYLKWLHCRFDFLHFSPPWLAFPPGLPRGYRLGLLAEADRTLIEQQPFSPLLPAHLRPFDPRFPIDPDSSMALWHGKLLVGWMSNCLIDEETVRYAAYWIDPDHRLPGTAISLLSASIQHQKKTKRRWAVCEVDWYASDKAWRRLMTRALVPYAETADWLASSGWQNSSSSDFPR